MRRVPRLEQSQESVRHFNVNPTFLYLVELEASSFQKLRHDSPVIVILSRIAIYFYSDGIVVQAHRLNCELSAFQLLRKFLADWLHFLFPFLSCFFQLGIILPSQKLCRGVFSSLIRRNTEDSFFENWLITKA